MIRRSIISGVLMALELWAGLGAAPRAFAQVPNQLSELAISVWPEHDRPTVLIMLDGTLADSSNLPRAVSVLVPSRATSLVTTYVNADGTFAPEQPSQSTDLGDGFAQVAFTTATSTYHVEYYDDLLRGAPVKTMDYTYRAFAPADHVTLQVQQPLKATNFTLIPSTQTSRTDSDGFQYYTFDLGKISAGQTITEQVKYTKTDPSPSVTRAAPASAPAPSSAASSPSPWNTVYILSAIVVLGLVAVLGFFLFQRSRDVSLARAPANGRTERRSAEGQNGEQVSGFCTQCGHALAADDEFCSRCGTKRRIAG